MTQPSPVLIMGTWRPFEGLLAENLEVPMINTVWGAS